MKNISLNINKGFSWFSSENISVKGYFFDNKNTYYEKENLISFFKNIKTKSDFITKIKEINGVFSVIVNIDKKIFVASDTTRMFPLFYSFKNKILQISDDITFLKKQNNSKICKNSSIEFKATAHTVGNKTLLENIFQIQSNQYIIFNENEIEEQNFFFSYSTNKTNQNSYQEQKQQAISIFENAFSRMIKSLNGKHVALPLSGGYDSRLIAVMLKKYGYENVTCFTYGRKNNKELENSRKTAEKLNYKWIFIEYNNNLIDNYINTDIFREYAHFVGKYSSMPLLQEYFAVKYLKENKIIPENSIFIPGHSGDFIGGSQLIKVVNNNLKFSKISSEIMKNKFFMNKISRKNKKEIQKNINDNLLLFDKNFKHKFPYSVFEDYDIKEKIAKFIFNSSSVYNFFGYQHRFPYWDKELISFFKTVPFKYKKQKLLYDDILKNTYFNKFNVNFETEIQPSSFDFFKQKIKNKIKKYLPESIKEKLRYNNDWIFYKESTDLMLRELQENNIEYNKNISSYNSIILQWYIEFCNENL